MGNGATDKAWARITGARLLVLIGLLAALQLYANRGVLDHDWVYFDDDINVVLNPHLTGGTADTWSWAWTDVTYNRRYMPLGWLMFDTLFRIGGLNPAVYHAASWLLAAANTITLLLIIRKFIAPRNQEGSPPSGWTDVCATLAAAFFSLHPLRAEITGWASALVYQGSTFLASLAVLAAFPTRQTAGRSTTEWLGRLLFLLSLLLYPVCIGLPVLLILAAGAMHATEGSRSAGTAIWSATRRYAVWLLLAAAVGVVNVFAAATSRTFSAIDGLQHYTLAARLGRSAAILGHLLGQLVWPGLTSPFYGDLGAAPALHRLFIPLTLAVALVAFLLWRRTRWTALSFALLLLGSVAPFIGLLDRGQTANDRYAFMPLAVVAVGVASLAVRAASPRTRLLVGFGLGAATILTMPLYRGALAAWRDTDTLQARVDAVTAARPDARLSFARPAMHGFLSGRYAESQQRLRAGFARFGPDPELVAAARFIEETRTSLTGSAANPKMPPYAYVHFELAKKHEAAGHAFAAKAHQEYARGLMIGSAEDRQP